MVKREAVKRAEQGMVFPGVPTSTWTFDEVAGQSQLDPNPVQHTLAKGPVGRTVGPFLACALALGLGFLVDAPEGGGGFAQVHVPVADLPHDPKLVLNPRQDGVVSSVQAFALGTGFGQFAEGSQAEVEAEGVPGKGCDAKEQGAGGNREDLVGVKIGD